MQLTEKERIEILMMIGYGDRMRTHEEVVVLFNETHPNRPSISQSMVSRIENNYRKEGNVKNKVRAKRLDVGEDVELNVLLKLEENPHTSLRNIASDLSVGKTTVSKIIHREKYHPFKVQLVQELSEDDFDRRVQFCEVMFEECNANPEIVKNILFSDEATFCLNGTINRQNCRYWATHNPHWIEESHTQHHQKVNVWAGIIDNRVVGPCFFDETLTGERYLDFLQFDLVPALAVLFPNDVEPDLPHPRILYQHDGAPPHYAHQVCNFLHQTFPNRWIGRRGPTEWPARSPDLTPVDYFLWGYLKNKIYAEKPNNIDDLKEKIRHEIRNITPEIVDNVQKEFILRLGHCLAVNGQHFEQLL